MAPKTSSTGSANLLALLVVSIWALAGCGKRPASRPAANQALEAGEPAAASEPGVPTSAAAANQARPPKTDSATQPLAGPVHPFMTSQLRRFIAENGRLPKDFSEFSRAKMDSVPRLPPGFKFAIDPVTQEVKLVPQ